MHVGNYLGLIHNSEQQLADACATIADHHANDPEVYHRCKLLSTWSQQHVQTLKPIIDRYWEQKSEEPARLSQTLFEESRTGSLALLRDLHDLKLLANEVYLCWIVLSQAAKARGDKELETACEQFDLQTKQQIAWLLTRIKQAAPQTLVVAE